MLAFLLIGGWAKDSEIGVRCIWIFVFNGHVFEKSDFFHVWDEKDTDIDNDGISDSDGSKQIIDGKIKMSGDLLDQDFSYATIGTTFKNITIPVDRPF